MSILLVDSYDSFTYNLRNLVQESIPGSRIYTIHNDALNIHTSNHSANESNFNGKNINDFATYINGKFDCVIIGPGPGDPNSDNNLGLIKQLVSSDAFSQLPMLGICLGFQAMAMLAGCRVENLGAVKHGQVAKIELTGKRGNGNVNPTNAHYLFSGCGNNFKSVRYHSLHAVLPNYAYNVVADSNNVCDNEGEKDMIPLAFTYDDNIVGINGEKINDYFSSAASSLSPSSSLNEISNLRSKERKILMAGKVKTKPFYGVQYHPESACSENGDLLIKNFWQIVQHHWLNNNYAKSANRNSECYIQQEQEFAKYFVDASVRLDIDEDSEIETDAVKESSTDIFKSTGLSDFFERPYNEQDIKHKSFIIKGAGKSNDRDTAITICDLLKQQQQEQKPPNFNNNNVNDDLFLLNSSSEPGQFSIIGCPIINDSIEVTWSVDDPHFVQLSKWQQHNNNNSFPISSIWDFLSLLMSRKFLLGSNLLQSLQLPFIGGLLGFISYEAGQYTDQGLARKHNEKAATMGHKPDVKMIFIERTVLYNETTGEVTVLSIKNNDDNWVDETLKYLENKLTKGNVNSLTLNLEKRKTKVTELLSKSNDINQTDKITITKPTKDQYFVNFDKCQEYLHNGDSYELCLCCPTQIRIPSYVKPWDIYKVLAHRNPAPFSGFLKFGDSVLISSSPERFLSWKNVPTDKSGNKEKDFDKLCQLRPIKGTVKKHPGLTIDQVTEILYSPKETGENLMIVDLIRHDLYSHCTATSNVTDVKVTKLMAIEEYKTVYQLVSVIECTIKGQSQSQDQEQGIKQQQTSGFKILSTSLPPGSMTGAPKKRSVELLQHDIEAKSYGNRGIYSGVFGYWSIDDQADWSVVIRSMFSYGADDYKKNAGQSSNINNDDNGKEEQFTDWRIGAGGAITVLSTAESEWEEMNTKLDSILQIFQ